MWGRQLYCVSYVDSTCCSLAVQSYSFYFGVRVIFNPGYIKKRSKTGKRGNCSFVCAEPTNFVTFVQWNTDLCSVSSCI